MTDLTDFLRTNERQQDRMNRLIDPLRTHLGIDMFWHLTIRENGLFTNLCSYHDPCARFFEDNWEKDVGYITCPKNLQNGYTFLDSDPDFSRFTDTHKDKYSIHHPLLIIRKDGQGRALMLGLASKKAHPTLPSLYLNHLPMLNKFFDHVIQEYERFYPLLEDNSLNMLELRGPEAFYGKEYNKEYCLEPARNYHLLKALGEDSTLLACSGLLSNREKQVVYASADGKTAGEISNELKLSLRTIEHYLSNAKNKLGIFSKQELIRCSRLLRETGLLELP